MAKTRLGENIKRLRTERGFGSARDLADASGVSISVVSELEAGRRKPSWIENLDRIATALNVPIGELLGERNWLSLPTVVDELAITANLSYREARELWRSWPYLVKMLTSAPDALKVLADHPELLHQLGESASAGNSNRTFVLLPRQEASGTAVKSD